MILAQAAKKSVEGELNIINAFSLLMITSLFRFSLEHLSIYAFSSFLVLDLLVDLMLQATFELLQDSTYFLLVLEIDRLFLHQHHLHRSLLYCFDPVDCCFLHYQNLPNLHSQNLHPAHRCWNHLMRYHYRLYFFRFLDLALLALVL